MAMAGAVTVQTKKLMNLGLSFFRRGFRSSKCKTAAKMAVARIKLLRNKRQVVVRQMRRDIATLLQSGQDSIARIRVEHVIREQNILTANEFIELFCELVVSRLTIISRQRECPADLKEGICSLIFAAPRCSEIPELLALKDIFEKKYGRDFVSAATDLRPNSGVNRTLIEKLSVRTPSGEVKLKIMKEIAKEYQVEWNTTESEKELLKPPEELIEGPRAFVSASSLPVKPLKAQSIEPNKLDKMAGSRENTQMNFDDTASAAEAAAESARKAIAAAEVAAYLAKKDFDSTTELQSVVDDNVHGFGYNSSFFAKNDSGTSNNNNEGDIMSSAHKGGGVFDRRHSYPVTYAHSDVKFDESDCDEDIDADNGATGPPQQPPPPIPSSRGSLDTGLRSHPKLPDYESLVSRFEALKTQKSKTRD